LKKDTIWEFGEANLQPLRPMFQHFIKVGAMFFWAP
jgi:hypothetical protein